MKVDLGEVVLAFEALTEERGPTICELRKYLGLSSISMVDHRLHGMLTAGLIERVDIRYASRGYRLTPLGKRLAEKLRSVETVP